MVSLLGLIITEDYSNLQVSRLKWQLMSLNTKLPSTIKVAMVFSLGQFIGPYMTSCECSMTCM